MALSKEQVDDIMTRFGQAFMHKDYNALAQVITEDAQWHFAFGPHAPDGFIYKGLEGFKQGIVDHSKRFQYLKFNDIEYCAAGDDKIVMTARVVGKYRDGSSINLRSIELISTQGNRICKKDVFWKQESVGV